MKATIADLVTSVTQDLLPHISFRRIYPFPVQKTSKDFSTWPGFAAQHTDSINSDYVKWFQHMVKVLLTLTKVPSTDAADALAVAICHAHVRETRMRLARAASSAR